MSGVGVGSSCPDCLRRSWLVEALSGHIQIACDHRPGKRIPELLSLEDEDLARAVAPRQADRILEEVASITDASMFQAIEDSDCWACCRHDGRFPEGLRESADGPRVIIGRGDPLRLVDLTREGSVTVVGARRASAYGLQVAGELGRDLAAAGLVVISGLALGIDGAAHRGALERGRSVAVLGSGADRPYPATHRGIYRSLVETGLVLSEMPPGSKPRRWSFPARNRVMAGLSQMTVVVEAAHRSGSLITAEMAMDCGREVGAVPGPVTVATAAGSNELIAGGAALIRDAADVIDQVIGVGAVPPRNTGPPIEPELGSVLRAVEEGSMTIDRIADVLAADAGNVAIALARLEIAGYIECSMLGSYARTTLATPYPSGDE